MKYTLSVMLLILLTVGWGCTSGDDSDGDTSIEQNVPSVPASQLTATSVQPRPAASTQTVSADGLTTTVVTPEGAFPSSDPFANPPGTNMFDTVYSNMLDGAGVLMPHTLPSTPNRPYNLHLTDPVVTQLDNKASPTDDLRAAFKSIRADIDSNVIQADGLITIQFALDILEGNPVPRVYTGMPMLHYNGPEKVKVVEPIRDAEGTITGGNVNVHQIWFDTHVESDTAFIDPSAVLEVPWKITYTIDTLNRGHEDFAPMVMYFDDPDLSAGQRVPHVSMDQTFFPMDDGTRTVFEIGMAPGKYYNLTYHWGWRIHPQRVQAQENALKVISDPDSGQKLTLPDWERLVFGDAPSATTASKEAAIAKIGDLSPAKRMWKGLRALQQEPSQSELIAKLDEIERAFDQWQNRNKLPDGVTADPDSDWTMFYVNNTIYGQVPEILDNTRPEFRQWTTRGTTVKIKLLNGDYFRHGYMNVDFGGRRGWENTFHHTIDVGGAGPWFTFGRHHWWVNAGNPKVGLILVPAAIKAVSTDRDTVGEHNVFLTLNYEPPLRLRWYQFDPLHHDVAIWPLH